MSSKESIISELEMGLNSPGDAVLLHKDFVKTIITELSKTNTVSETVELDGR